MANSTEVIRAARALNPRMRVLARAAYLRESRRCGRPARTRVYAGEGEVALAFIEDILASLGATAEQIDRERARAHTSSSPNKSGQIRTFHAAICPAEPHRSVKRPS